MLDRLLAAIRLSGLRSHQRLPADIRTIITDMVTGSWPERPSATRCLQNGANHPALTPPATGASPFMKLPAELRRMILAESLPARDEVFDPLCDDKEADVKKKARLGDASRKIDKNAHTTPNLMTICRQLCAEMTEVVYNERTFLIHVHEGLNAGGVEILNAGRQPLQYQDCTADDRFTKFKRGEEYGFQRMKKLIIQIFPTSETGDRHVAINTHFMNLALCRHLERPNDEKERITTIKIEFAKRDASSAAELTSRAAILRHEKPWKDVSGPRCSSIHNVSDTELALRPFAILTRCHSASIELPSYLADDKHLTAFVNNLEQSMTSKTGTLMPDDHLEHNIERLREEMEYHIRFVLHGKDTSEFVPKLTDKEVAEEADSEDEYVDSGSDLDDWVVGPSGELSAKTRSKKKKHGRSPASSTITGPLAKKTKASGVVPGKAPGMKFEQGEIAELVRGHIKEAGVNMIPEEFELLVREQVAMYYGGMPDLSTNNKLKGTPAHSQLEYRASAAHESVTGKSERLKAKRARAKATANSPATYTPTADYEDDAEMEVAKQLSSGAITRAQANGLLRVQTDEVNSRQQAGVANPGERRGTGQSLRLAALELARTSALLPPLEDMGVDIDYGTPGAFSTNNRASTAPPPTIPGPTSWLGSADSFSIRRPSNPLYTPAMPNSPPQSMSMPDAPSTLGGHPSAVFPRPSTVAGAFVNAAYMPRALVQNEDSGIGMLASDDGKTEDPFNQQAKTEADAEKDKMEMDDFFHL